MPELPEVETIINQIRPAVLNSSITSVEVRPKGERMVQPKSIDLFTNRLKGRAFTDLTRHGKFMIFTLDDAQQLIGHLRMSGIMQISKAPLTNNHNRIILGFGNGNFLNFVDTRRFGTFHLIKPHDNYPGITSLGPDALSKNFNEQYLIEQLGGRTKNIYNTLLDQTIVAGLGNIYVNEVLFRSKIKPTRRSGKVTSKETGRLVKNIRKVLKEAIDYRGTTLIDKGYRDTGGDEGKFFDRLQVYGKEGEVCKKCKSTINRIKIGGRSVYVCEECQV